MKTVLPKAADRSSSLQFFDPVYVVAFIVVTVIDSFHVHFSVIDLVSQRIPQYMLDLDVLDRAAFHCHKIVVLIDFAPVNDSVDLCQSHQYKRPPAVRFRRSPEYVCIALSLQLRGFTLC